MSFVAGSFAAVLILASIIDPDIFLHFEITPGRSVVFYIGIFASVLAVARGMIPEENFVFYPEELMTEVIQFTHYMPNEWKGQLHSQKVCDGCNILLSFTNILIGEVSTISEVPEPLRLTRSSNGILLVTSYSNKIYTVTQGAYAYCN